MARFPAAAGGTGTISEITSTGNTVTITDPSGPVTDLEVSAPGTGTVTSVSVASANGFAGTVATPTVTPAITLETTLTGILKGNGTAMSAAAAGTDYLAPAGSGAALTGITAPQVGADASGAAAAAQAASVPAQALTGDVTTVGLAATLVGTTNVESIIAANSTVAGKQAGPLTGDVTTVGQAATLVGTTNVESIIAANSTVAGKQAGPLTGDVTTVGQAATLVGTTNSQTVIRASTFQDAPERAGIVGAASAGAGFLNNGTRYGACDLVIGDSTAAGIGATIGVTSWDAILTTTENRRLGLADAGRGWASCSNAFDTDVWNSLAAGAAVTTGVLGGPGPIGTSWKLTATGNVIGDSRYNFRRIKIYYYLQTNGATVTFATTGNVVSSGSLATAGTNGALAVWDSGDLTYINGTGFTCTAGTVAGSGATSSGVVIAGVRYYNVAGTSGVTQDNFGIGGTTAAMWETSISQLTTFLTYQAGTGVPYRRCYIVVGINDALGAGSAYGTYQTNLTTIVSTIQTASPLTEVVLVAQWYGDQAYTTTSGATTTTGGATATGSSGFASEAQIGSLVSGLGIPTGVTVQSVASTTLTMTGNTAGITGESGITLSFTQNRGGAANWLLNWVGAVEAVALAQDCTLVNLYERFGNISVAAVVNSVTTTTTPSGGGYSASVSSGGFPNVAVGMAVYGTGITAGTSVVSISSNTIILSLAPYSTGTITLNFGYDVHGFSDGGIHLGDYSESTWGLDGQRAMAETFLQKLGYSRQIPAPPTLTTVSVSGVVAVPATGWYQVTVIGPGGPSGGAGSASTAATLQSGSAGGGQGEVKTSIQFLTVGTAYTCTIGTLSIGGTGGAAGVAGNPGTAGTIGTATIFAGQTTVAAAPGGVGTFSGAASTAGTSGGIYGFPGAQNAAQGLPGSGGWTGVFGMSLPGGAAIGYANGPGAGGGQASATKGGGAGTSGGPGTPGGGTIGANGASSTAAGVSATAPTFNFGAGAGGAGGGATTGAGGNGCAGGPGGILILGPL
jgi:hypothetical protein